MLGALILLFGVGYAIAKLNPAAIYGKRAAAIVWAKASGLDRYLTEVRASGNGWVFVVPVDRRAEFLTQLERKPPGATAHSGIRTAGGTDSLTHRPRTATDSPSEAQRVLANGQRLTANGSLSGFLSGSLYMFHAKAANCREFGQCRDYRSPNGSIGPGSLQIVYNRATGQGFLDYDQWNPYESWANFARHAGEI